ncbi:MAG: hypothetical protein RR893_10800, partial [Clostridia bacterium]
VPLRLRLLRDESGENSARHRARSLISASLAESPDKKPVVKRLLHGGFLHMDTEGKASDLSQKARGARATVRRLGRASIDDGELSV